MNSNLWQLNNENEINETDNVVSIIKEQAAYLKDITNGAVKAKFGKIKTVGIAETLAALSAATKGKEVVEGDNTSELSDANSLYMSTRYGFEIFNLEYKFRIFELVLSPSYPISIIPDEDISKELVEEGSRIIINKTKISVKSDDELLNSLAQLFSSRKVRFIIQKMIEQAKSEEQDV